MPEQTQQAIEWALMQSIDGVQVTINSQQNLTDKVREYFNANNISYMTFSYTDLIQFF